MHSYVSTYRISWLATKVLTVNIFDKPLLQRFLCIETYPFIQYWNTVRMDWEKALVRVVEVEVTIRFSSRFINEKVVWGSELFSVVDDEMCRASCKHLVMAALVSLVIRYSDEMCMCSLTKQESCERTSSYIRCNRSRQWISELYSIAV